MLLLGLIMVYVLTLTHINISNCSTHNSSTVYVVDFFFTKITAPPLNIVTFCLIIMESDLKKLIGNSTFKALIL